MSDGEGLRWEGFSADDFADFLDMSSAKTRRESKKVLRQGAKDIMEASMEMAPIDEGDLEAAHQLALVRLNKDDMQVEISVGGEVGGRNVDEYAEVQHEMLGVNGSKLDGNGGWKLGDKSDLKNAARSHPHRTVGGHFLDRAVDEYEDEIAAKLAQTLPGD